MEPHDKNISKFILENQDSILLDDFNIEYEEDKAIEEKTGELINEYYTTILKTIDQQK